MQSIKLADDLAESLIDPLMHLPITTSTDNRIVLSAIVERFKDFVLAASRGSVDGGRCGSSSFATLACLMMNASIQLRNFDTNGQLYMRTAEILMAQSLHGLSCTAKEMCGPVNTPQFDALNASIKALKVAKQASMVANLDMHFVILGTDFAYNPPR